MNQIGLGPEELADIRPGLVYVSINCYGADGPFSHRAGWDQIAQIMTGIAAEGVQSSSVYRPKPLPAAANDYITGYLGAYGTLLALARRARRWQLSCPRVIMPDGNDDLRSGQSQCAARKSESGG